MTPPHNKGKKLREAITYPIPEKPGPARDKTVKRFAWPLEIGEWSYGSREHEADRRSIQEFVQVINEGLTPGALVHLCFNWTSGDVVFDKNTTAHPDKAPYQPAGVEAPDEYQEKDCLLGGWRTYWMQGPQLLDKLEDQIIGAVGGLFHRYNTHAPRMGVM